MVMLLKVLCPLLGLALIVYVSFGVTEFEGVEDDLSIVVMGVVIAVMLQLALLLVPRALEQGLRYRVVVLLGMVPSFAMVVTSVYECLAQLLGGRDVGVIWPSVMIPAVLVYVLAVTKLLLSLRRKELAE